MKKIYYLSTCDTCARIIRDLGLKKKGFEFQDIKTEKISPAQLDEMKKMAGSYEALFSRIALKYRKLDQKPAKEPEYKKLILGEYTFLKRPVIIYHNNIFIGNAPNVIRSAGEAIG